MSLILENVLLSATDGLVQSGDHIWFHFQKYHLDLSNTGETPTFGEHSRNINTRLTKGLPDPSKAFNLNGTYHLGISPHIYSYYHLLTDLLAHLIDSPKHPVLVPKFIPVEFVKFLTESGFEVKVLPPEIFRIEKLFIPEMKTPNWNKKKVKKVKTFFNNIYPHETPPFYHNSIFKKKIYISRKLAVKRHLTNEEEFLPILEKHNFLKIYLEQLSIKEQVELFRTASHVIGAHGAGLTNVLFAPSNLKILEIRPVISSGQFCFEKLFSLGWPNFKIIVPPQVGEFILPKNLLEEVLVHWQ